MYYNLINLEGIGDIFEILSLLQYIYVLNNKMHTMLELCTYYLWPCKVIKIWCSIFFFKFKICAVTVCSMLVHVQSLVDILAVTHNMAACIIYCVAGSPLWWATMSMYTEMALKDDNCIHYMLIGLIWDFFC